jgi:hypothetical protein
MEPPSILQELTQSANNHTICTAVCRKMAVLVALSTNRVFEEYCQQGDQPPATPARDDVATCRVSQRSANVFDIKCFPEQTR